MTVWQWALQCCALLRGRNLTRGRHSAQVATLQGNCTRLREHTAASEAQCATLEAEATEMDARWRAAAAETARLCAELDRMRRLCQVRLSETTLLPRGTSLVHSVSTARL